MSLYFSDFLRFYIDFTSLLFNVSWAPGPKCNFFFTFRSCRPASGRQAPCRPGRGRHGYSFEIFRNRHIFLKFYFFLNTKMKKILHHSCRLQPAGPGRSLLGRRATLPCAKVNSFPRLRTAEPALCCLLCRRRMPWNCGSNAPAA